MDDAANAVAAAGPRCRRARRALLSAIQTFCLSLPSCAVRASLSSGRTACLERAALIHGKM
jgi:hypothetical protein